MLRVVFILSLATTAMAAKLRPDEDVTERVVRIGGIGTSPIDVKGVVEPVTTIKGIPSFHLKNTRDGVPVEEKSNVRFRCSRIGGLTSDNPEPVLMCRREALERAGVPVGSIILTAGDLGIPGNIYDLYLSLGSSLWQKIVELQAGIFSLVPSVVPIYVPGTARALYTRDDLNIVRSSHPFETLLTYDIPVERTKRQFGGGFSGSGAQAGASSFGGGGGFGGFPGGGFGGGISGSQASAGAGSFGGGGGFFG